MLSEQRTAANRIGNDAGFGEHPVELDEELLLQVRRVEDYERPPQRITDILETVSPRDTTWRTSPGPARVASFPLIPLE